MKDRIRVISQKGEQTKFLIKAKTSLGYTWKEMASFCGVSRSMIFTYLNETNTLPKNIFDKISSTGVGLTEFADRQFFKLSFSRRRKYAPKLPAIYDENLAEFVGILLGDGHLGPSNYEISVTGDRLTDGWYIRKHVSALIEYLFETKPFVYEQAGPKNVIRCRLYCNDVFNFLVKKLGLPAGRRIGNDSNKIPGEIFANTKSLKACLRGLFDTDGGFHRHHPRTAMVEFYNRSPTLLKSIEEALRHLQFRISIDPRSIQIYCRDEIDRFFLEVGSRNPKNLIKYKMWKINGEVPINQDIKHLLVRPWSSLAKEFSASRLRPSKATRRACNAGSNPAGRTTNLSPRHRPWHYFTLLLTEASEPKYYENSQRHQNRAEQHGQ